MKKLKKKIKKMVLKVLSFRMIAQGYTVERALDWTRKVYRNYKKRPVKQVRWAVKRGFLPYHVKLMNLNDKNYKDVISPKEYAFLRPMNGTYKKWLSDKVTINAIFKPFRNVMPVCYYQIVKRDGENMIIPLYDKQAGDTFEDIFALIKEKGEVILSNANGGKAYRIKWEENQFYVGKKNVEVEQLEALICSYKGNAIISEAVRRTEAFKGLTVKLVVYNEQGDNPVIGEASLNSVPPKKKKRRKIATMQFDIAEDTVDKLEGINLTLDTENFNLDDSVEESEETEVAIATSDVDIDEVDFEEVEIEANKQAQETMDYLTSSETYEEEDDEEAEAKKLRKTKIYARVDIKTGKVEEAFSTVDGEKVLREENPFTNVPLPKQIPYWDEITKTVEDICRFTPQLEFFGLNLAIVEDGFKIMKMTNTPSYPVRIPFSKATSDFLKGKVAQKKEAYAASSVRRQRGFKKIRLAVRAAYARAFFPEGILPYLTLKYLADQKKDRRTNKDTTRAEKRWAKKHGFLSYRLHQYGITEENYKNYISDFEYKWLRHINGKYRAWMEDKITVKYICSDYKDCFPAYYYHISLKNGNNKVVSLMDCPEGYSNTYEDIFRLVEEKGCLALKPDEGSHGDGFYKFAYEDGKYYLNHQEAEKQDVLNILEDVKNQYLVTEYINMHPVIKNIYAGAVNTIRMIVFKKDGKNPVIGNAYMRFGSSRTGAVDNMGAGGMFAKIDIETGKFFDAKIIEANEIKECLYHPDTNVKIEGYLPNWEKVKSLVLEVARDIPQLEYFGFDLAITEDGLKFPEINRFPDYPAIEKYSEATMDYLLYKLQQKKLKYGDPNFRGTKLVKLPER